MMSCLPRTETPAEANTEMSVAAECLYLQQLLLLLREKKKLLEKPAERGSKRSKQIFEGKKLKECKDKKGKLLFTLFILFS